MESVEIPNDKLGREFKSLINSAKESKVISEYISVDKLRKSRRDAYDSSSSVDKGGHSRASSANSNYSDVTPDKSANAMRSMRSQNAEFVMKQKRFMKSLTERTSIADVSDDEAPKTVYEEVKHAPSIVTNFGRFLDPFCWECHKEGSQMLCSVCPRSYHSKCLHSKVSNKSDGAQWACPECVKCMDADDTSKRSPAMKNVSLPFLKKLLEFALLKLENLPGSEPFLDDVNSELFPDYHKYVVNPMNMKKLHQKLNALEYGSTNAFFSDVRWILHNSVIFNSKQAKLTSVAKSIMKTCRTETNEIETCPECYFNSNTKSDWFIQPCSKPHILLWAKVKGFPFWPAKAMAVSGTGTVNVRFFGAHDRAWVEMKHCFLYSLKDPNNNNKTRKNEIAVALEELKLHVSKLIEKFGAPFNPAVYKAPYSPHNDEAILKLMLPSYVNKNAHQGPPVILPFSPETKTPPKKKRTPPKKKTSPLAVFQSSILDTTKMQPKVLLTTFSKEFGSNTPTHELRAENEGAKNKKHAIPTNTKPNQVNEFNGLYEQDYKIGAVISTYQRTKTKNNQTFTADNEVETTVPAKRLARSKSICAASEYMESEEELEEERNEDVEEVSAERELIRKRTLSEAGSLKRKIKESVEIIKLNCAEITPPSKLRSRGKSADSKMMTFYRQAVSEKYPSKNICNDSTENNLGNLSDDVLIIDDSEDLNESLDENKSIEDAKINENECDSSAYNGVMKSKSNASIIHDGLDNVRLESVKSIAKSGLKTYPKKRSPDTSDANVVHVLSDSEESSNPTTPTKKEENCPKLANADADSSVITKKTSNEINKKISSNKLDGNKIVLMKPVKIQSPLVNKTLIGGSVSNVNENTNNKSDKAITNDVNKVVSLNTNKDDAIVNKSLADKPIVSVNDKEPMAKVNDVNKKVSVAPNKDAGIVNKSLADKPIVSVNDKEPMTKVNDVNKKVSVNPKDDANKATTEEPNKIKISYGTNNNDIGKIKLIDTKNLIEKKTTINNQQQINSNQDKESFIHSLSLRPADSPTEVVVTKKQTLTRKALNNKLLENSSIESIVCKLPQDITAKKISTKRSTTDNPCVVRPKKPVPISNLTVKNQSPVVSGTNNKRKAQQPKILVKKVKTATNLSPSQNPIENKTTLDSSAIINTSKSPTGLKVLSVNSKNVIKVMQNDSVKVPNAPLLIKNSANHNSTEGNSSIILSTPKSSAEITSSNYFINITPDCLLKTPVSSVDDGSKAQSNDLMSNIPPLVAFSESPPTYSNLVSTSRTEPAGNVKNFPQNSSVLNSTTVNPATSNDATPDVIQPDRMEAAIATINNHAAQLQEYFKQLVDKTLQELGSEHGVLQAKVFSLTAQLQKLKWQHAAKIKELQYSTDVRFREFCTCLEAERQQAIADCKMQAENDKRNAVNETKKKHWCANCFAEAQLYCCSNAMYCEYKCQQFHWPKHVSDCKQESICDNVQSSIIIPVTVSNSGSGNIQRPFIYKKYTPGSNFSNANNLITSSSQSTSGIVSPRFKILSPVIGNPGNATTPTIYLAPQFQQHNNLNNNDNNAQRTGQPLPPNNFITKLT